MAPRCVEAQHITADGLAQLIRMEREGVFRLRDEDAKECIAAGMKPSEAIADSVQNSIESFVVCIDNHVAAVWGYGVQNRLNGIGYPWLLTTPIIEQNKFFFAKASRQAIWYLHKQFPRLEVLVDARYLRAHAWLEWLGFKSHQAAIMIKDSPFMFMYKER